MSVCRVVDLCVGARTFDRLGEEANAKVVHHARTCMLILYSCVYTLYLYVHMLTYVHTVLIRVHSVHYARFPALKFVCTCCCYNCKFSKHAH